MVSRSSYFDKDSENSDKKPSGQPKTIELELWGRSIKVATDPELGRVRLEIISLPVLSLEDKQSKPEEDYQPELDLGEEDWYWVHFPSKLHVILKPNRIS